MGREGRVSIRRGGGDETGWERREDKMKSGFGDTKKREAEAVGREKKKRWAAIAASVGTRKTSKQGDKGKDGRGGEDNSGSDRE